MDKLGEVHVRENVLTPIRRMWPTGVLQERLLPQLLGDTKTLEWPKASYARAPVLVLGFPCRRPFTGDEFAYVACNHNPIVSHRLVWSQIIETPTLVG
jgi:hypothetical protein